MVDFGQKAVRKVSGRLPLDDALEPLKKQPFIAVGPNAPHVQRTWAAFSGDKDRLDLGDVFCALAHPSLYSNAEVVRTRLLEILGYREEDPLEFKTLPLGPNQQLALTIIELLGRDPAEPTLIFAAGFAHPASLYMGSMVALAKALHTKVVVIDQPGNGGSQSSTTVNQKDIYKALKLAITSEVTDGEKYYVGGHGMGSSPAYQLFQDIKAGKTPVGNRELVRMVVINPVSTRLQETSGCAGGSRLFMRSGAARMTTILAAQDMDDITPHVGRDTRLAVLLSKNDSLMNWNVGAYEDRRGYHLIDGDHGACLIGRDISSLCTKHLATAFRGEPDDRVPLATVGHVYRRASGSVRLGLNWRSDNTAVISPEITLKYGILSVGSVLGVYLGSGIVSEVGYRWGEDHHGIATSHTQIYLGTEGLRWPIDLKAGARGGVDFVNNNHPITYGLMTSLSTNLARILDIEVQGRFTLSGKFQDLVAGFAVRFL